MTTRMALWRSNMASDHSNIRSSTSWNVSIRDKLLITKGLVQSWNWLRKRWMNWSMMESATEVKWCPNDEHRQEFRSNWGALTPCWLTRKSSGLACNASPLFYWMLKRRIISSFNHPAFCSPEGGASLALQAFLRSSRTPSSPKLL